MADDKTVDLDLLNKNLAEIEDLPSFEVPPKGAYVMLLTAGTKYVNAKPAVTIDMEVVSTVQLANPQDKPVVDGSKTGVMFFLNEDGLPYLKKFLTPFAAHFNTDNIRELVTEKIQNLVCGVTMDHRVDKSDKSKVYANPKNITIQ